MLVACVPSAMIKLMVRASISVQLAAHSLMVAALDKHL